MPDDHLLITDGATIAYQLSGPPNTVPVGHTTNKGQMLMSCIFAGCGSVVGPP